jgi:tetratricopeptide (TPR) repeat protein
MALVAALAAVPAVLAVPAGRAVPPADGPRPLSVAEREAAQLAADYLAGGPAAWWPHLARGAWLRTLGRDAALGEIEVRAGLPAGSRWVMQAAPPAFAEHGAVFTVEFPSGADDTLLLELVPEDGAWKIDALHVAGEPGAAPAGLAAAAAAAAAAGEGAGGSQGAGERDAAPAPPVRDHRIPLWAVWTAVSALGLAGAAAVLGARRRIRRLRHAARGASPRAGASFVVSAPPPAPLSAVGLAAAGILALAAAAVAAAGVLGFLPVPGWSGAVRPGGLFGGRAGAAETGARTASGGPAPVALRSLLPLRRALTQPVAVVAAGAPGPAPAPAQAPAPAPSPAAGSPAAETHRQQADPVDALAAGAQGDAASARVALLWRAQQRVERGDLPGAEELLGQLPAPGAGQFGEVLRARLSLLRLQPVETAVAYERALAGGVAHEGLLLEMAQALYILGFEDRARSYLRSLAQLGARGADSWYLLADLALLDGRDAEAHQRFRTAWALQPISRAELLAQSLSAFMLQDLELRRLMSLGSFAEPVGSCRGMSDRALALPPGVSAQLLGAVLRLTAAGGEVRLPGACDLAPAGTALGDAVAWQEERDVAALARLPELRQAAASAGALAQPALRRRTQDAATALAERQRWQELIDITRNLDQPTAILPPRLARLRAAALDRLDRPAEARQLLIRLALGNKAKRVADPGALYQLAGLLEKSGDFDQAMRLVAKADSELPRPPSGERLRRLQMEKRLATAADELRSPHFVVSYPASRGTAFAQEAVRILDAERERLRRWIPVAAGGKPIVVLLLPFEDFELGYSQGGQILGLFDGVVRLPLGGLRTWSPFAVSILSHELAHALITEHTRDRAPHWFQEGLAQHIEMTVDRVNAVADYRAQDRLLALPLLEPAIASFSSAVWEAAAYDEALWAINFVESRHGVAGIHRLLDAFRDGETTNQALATALGTPAARFDHDLWDWCLTAAPRVWHLDIIRYDGGPFQPRRF